MSEDLQGVLFSEKSKVQVTVTSYISIRFTTYKKEWDYKSIFIFV